MRSEILVHSISLLNQVSIAMGPVHCQVSGESTGKWKCQRRYEIGAAGPVKWWAVKSKMNEWSPQGSSDHFLKESFFGFQDKTSCQWATASFPRGLPFLFILFPSHHSYLPFQVFLIPAAGSLNRRQAKTCRGLSLASCFGKTEPVSLSFRDLGKPLHLQNVFHITRLPCSINFLNKNRCTQYLGKCKCATGHPQLYKASIIPAASDPTLACCDL